MKPSAILCNVSRGGTVNQDDLFDALISRSIYGAALGNGENVFIIIEFQKSLVTRPNKFIYVFTEKI